MPMFPLKSGEYICTKITNIISRNYSKFYKIKVILIRFTILISTKTNRIKDPPGEKDGRGAAEPSISYSSLYVGNTQQSS